jgi:dTDP-glucose pyrophosphorylase
MKLVIFAGGLGTRISEETDYVPKPMVKILKNQYCGKLLSIIQFLVFQNL